MPTLHSRIVVFCGLLSAVHACVARSHYGTVEEEPGPCVDDIDCDDGNPCTHSDFCSASSCSGTTYACDDGNPCTDDLCNGDATCSFVDDCVPPTICDPGAGTCVTQLCANGSIEGNEVCDGADLSDEDCLSQGFDGGLLACNNACTAFDTSACTLCNNNVLEDGEQCDGTDFGDEFCTTLGFAGGTLDCSSTCTFDLSGCFNG